MLNLHSTKDAHRAYKSPMELIVAAAPPPKINSYPTQFSKFVDESNVGTV